MTTRAWLERLAVDPDGADVYVLDGQTRPSFVRSAVERVDTAVVRVVLLDCAAHARHARLAGPRGQPELSNLRMGCWAAYLRGRRTRWRCRSLIRRISESTLRSMSIPIDSGRGKHCVHHLEYRPALAPGP